jgi:hypothetical protein
MIIPVFHIAFAGFVDAAAWATASSITAARAQLLDAVAIEVKGVFLGPSSTMLAVEVHAGPCFAARYTSFKTLTVTYRLSTALL